jgi:hypothetical protein
MHAPWRSYRSRHLVSCLSAAFALAGFHPHGYADTLPVTECDDSGGAETLRGVISGAHGGTGVQSGDVVDLSGSGCSSITLSSGQITLGHGVEILGAGFDQLTIHGSGGRIFYSDTSEQLLIRGLTLADGSVSSPTGDAYGGCILASGDVYLQESVVTHCSANAPAGVAAGGAIFAPGTVSLLASAVTNSTASAYFEAFGGGVRADDLLAAYGTLSGNSAVTAKAGYAGFGRGGGAYVWNGKIVLNSSTVDSNISGDGGGIGHFIASGSESLATTKIYNTTFSGNAATVVAGAMDQYCFSCTTPDITIYNSTIAFNTNSIVGGIAANANIVAHSSIFSNNGAGSTFSDLFFWGEKGTLSGANNLVLATNATPATGVITVTSDPMLTPLDYHGASTSPLLYARTLGLSINSPAIGKGDDLLNLGYDERGDQNGGFPREDGSGHVDIGAFQRQPDDDELFYGGFN